MIFTRFILLSCAFLFLIPAARAQNTQLGLRVPSGFEVSEFAGSDLANDIYCMTTDPKGRVVVSGRGYIRLLTGEQGKANKVVEFAGAPKDGAMGLFWEGDDLYCMGDGGLLRYRNAGGDGRAKAPELLHRFKTGGEHEAHAIRRGPDGWLYVLCGNNTGVRAGDATLPTSPIKEPIAGCMLRFSPDFKGCEIVADGFRNAYGFDFNSDGEWFTYDSDNERCVSLPWYEPTRLYHVVSGGHYGWRNPQQTQTWRFPPYFADVAAPIATLGRGSPTGVICYRHAQFPENYRGGLFLLDWTFGRVWFTKLTRSGSTYKAESQLFLEAAGDNGFAPTAGAIDPTTGDLYVSIGGRGTRGAVYRIRHTAGFQTVKTEDSAQLQPAPRSLDWQPDSSKTLSRDAVGADLHERRTALAMMLRHVKQFEAPSLEKALAANLGHEDRGLRQAACSLLGALEGPAQARAIASLRDPAALTSAYLVHADAPAALQHAVDVLGNPKLSTQVQLDAVRLAQRALGDLTSPKAKGTVWEGYSRRREVAVPLFARTALRAAFPSRNDDLNREISRTLALIEDDDAGVLARVAERIRSDSDPIEDIHYLIVAARLRGQRTSEITSRIAVGLLALDRKIAERKMNRESNWPSRIGETLAELVRKDPALPAVMLSHADFGRPDHAGFTKTAGFDRRRAAEIFVERSKKTEDFAWNPALIDLLRELPAKQSLPILRGLWGEYGLDDAILPLLARDPQETDRARFFKVLASAQTGTVRLAIEALERLPPASKREEQLALILALKRLPQGKEEDKVAQQLIAYLEKATGTMKLGLSRDAWSAWFAKKHPDLAQQLGGSDGVDVESWTKRFAKVDWAAGNAERGRVVFTKTSCAGCHSGAQALGPDLRGVAGRFSRADLFTAIIQPSKDVSARYRTTQVTTAEGKSYQGIIIYEAVDSVILQTGPALTLRLIDKQIVQRRMTTNSLMPAGLIDKLTDGEIADLYGFLKELK